ncbi:hypothetical protein ACFU1R_20410 [Priestia megaterium]|uniref:hypothetical protein n=1 Tax=Priestia megaterium TaxID=1404 RepID=UPI0036711D1F
MTKKVECLTCDKVIAEKEAWELSGRDSEDIAYFCSDGCRMAFPFRKKRSE